MKARNVLCLAVLFLFSSVSTENIFSNDSNLSQKGDGQGGCWNVVFSPNGNDIDNELVAVTGSGNDERTRLVSFPPLAFHRGFKTVESTDDIEPIHGKIPILLCDLREER